MRCIRDNNKTTVSTTTSEDVSVQILDFEKLATECTPLILDTYQRPYVWDEDKVTQLLQDFTDFIDNDSLESHRQYYLGTILLHEKNEPAQKQYCVIDGQQRLTTLAILYWLLHDRLPKGIQFTFRSVRSLANVQQVRNTIRNKFDEHPQLQQHFINLLKHLRFTVIRVTSEDLAFTFFDTQNNRGVPLGSTDLLKAFHLRAIQNHDEQQVEHLQSLCARKWEQVQQCGERVKQNNNYDFAPNLFHYYLWRARNWRGSDVKELESRDDMLNHFGEHSLPAEVGQVALFSARANVWGKALTLTQNNDLLLTPAIQYASQNALHLPFSLRQPISRGVGFFLFTEKYAQMIQNLLFSKSSDVEINAIQDFYRVVVSTLSAYLQSLFQLALLAYVDRLGTHGLLRFSFYLDHRLGALRLSQADIRRETPLKFLRDAKQNLLDVIAQAYVGDEVVNFLKTDNVDKSYSQNASYQKNIDMLGSNVQERYIKALAKYYALTKLSDKRSNVMEMKVNLVLHSAPNSENSPRAGSLLHV